MTEIHTLHIGNTVLRNAAAANEAPQTQQPKIKYPERPIIDTDTDEQGWELFKDSWNRYKTMTGINNENMLRMELRAACSHDVNKLLFEFVGADILNAATENTLLDHIKSVAVKGTHKVVRRMNFFRLYQMDGETTTQFVARLRSQAMLCQFKITCHNHDPPTFINFADEMITQQLVAGLKNQQHQSRIISEADALPSLREKIDRLQCLESTEQSTDIMRSKPSATSSITF